MKKLFSKEHKKHISESKKGQSHPQTQETRLKISKSHMGLKPSKETLIKLSESHRGKFLGEKSPSWKGGKKLYLSRARSKRRELGNNFLNNSNIGLEGHHINMNCIIYIPKEINHFCYHNVRTGKNMNIVNYLALMWLILSREINNCVEV